MKVGGGYGYAISSCQCSHRLGSEECCCWGRCFAVTRGHKGLLCVVVRVRIRVRMKVTGDARLSGMGSAQELEEVVSAVEAQQQVQQVAWGRGSCHCSHMLLSLHCRWHGGAATAVTCCCHCSHMLLPLQSHAAATAVTYCCHMGTCTVGCSLAYGNVACDLSS